MTNLHDALARLSRPRLLIRAARFGLSDYRRTPAMRRSLAAATARRPEEIVTHLMRREAEIDGQRRAGDAAYSVARHVDVLIALMAEARHLPPTAQPGPGAPARRTAPVQRRAAAPRGQEKASGIPDLRRATKASSASSVPLSIAGA